MQSTLPSLGDVARRRRVLVNYDYSKTPDPETVTMLIQLAGWDVRQRQGTLYRHGTTELVTPEGYAYVMQEHPDISVHHTLWKTFLELTHRKQ